jgi:hypothetical protein
VADILVKVSAAGYHVRIVKLTGRLSNYSLVRMLGDDGGG